MEQLKQEMIAEASRRNGIPLSDKSFEEYFTYEAYFKTLLLGFSVDTNKGRIVTFICPMLEIEVWGEAGAGIVGGLL